MRENRLLKTEMMQMLHNFAYYLIYASALLIYGIGINRSVLLSSSPRHMLRGCLKMLLSVSASSSLTYLIVMNLLHPVRLTELYPFVAVLVYAVISIFIESVIRITSKKSATEYTVSVLAILLGVNESISLLDCVVNSCFCVLSCFMFLPVLYAVRKRTEVFRPKEDKKTDFLLLLSIAVIMIILLVWNVSWLNQGGIARW